MKRGQFFSQIEESWKIVKELNIHGDRNWSQSYVFNPAAQFRNQSYVEIWEDCLRNQLYTFSLVDNSLIQFRPINFDPLRVSYAFYECPFEAIGYDDFLLENLETSSTEVGDEFRKEYEDFLMEESWPKETVTPIRYDYDPDMYMPSSHPASHIHFGHSNSIRVGALYLLNPISFTLFVIRQFYVEAWKMLVQSSEARVWCRNVRESLDRVDATYFDKLDDWEMLLS